MKRLLSIALAVATPAYAQESGGSLRPEEYNALQIYFACIYQQVSDNDDGAADPQSLTPKVAPTCRYLLGTAATIFSHGDKAQREALYNKWLGLEEGQVAKTLWTVRQERLVSGEPTAPVTASAAPEPQTAPVQFAEADMPAPRSAAPRPKPAATTGADARPMSEWRRAYIAKHGHEPPVAAK
jgi:hypothetical protein